MTVVGQDLGWQGTTTAAVAIPATQARQPPALRISVTSPAPEAVRHARPQPSPDTVLARRPNVQAQGRGTAAAAIGARTTATSAIADRRTSPRPATSTPRWLVSIAGQARLYPTTDGGHRPGNSLLVVALRRPRRPDGDTTSTTHLVSPPASACGTAVIFVRAARDTHGIDHALRVVRVRLRAPAPATDFVTGSADRAVSVRRR